MCSKLHRMHRYFNGITIQMPQLRKFFLSKPETDGSEAPDESWRISRCRKAVPAADRLCRRRALRGGAASLQPGTPRFRLRLFALSGRGGVALAFRGAGRLGVGAGLVALRLPVPAGDRPGGPLFACTGDLGVAGGLGGADPFPEAQHPLSARRRTGRLRGA